MEITNKIPYLIEEWKKAKTLLQSLIAEYNTKPKRTRYNRLSAIYRGRAARYAKQLNEIGKVGTITRVEGYVTVKGIVILGGVAQPLQEKKAVMYLVNVSDADAKRIIKRDFKMVKGLKTSKIVPGEIIDLSVESHF